MWNTRFEKKKKNARFTSSKLQSTGKKKKPKNRSNQGFFRKKRAVVHTHIHAHTAREIIAPRAQPLLTCYAEPAGEAGVGVSINKERENYTHTHTHRPSRVYLHLVLALLAGVSFCRAHAVSLDRVGYRFSDKQMVIVLPITHSILMYGFRLTRMKEKMTSFRLIRGAFIWENELKIWLIFKDQVYVKFFEKFILRFGFL